MIITTTLINGWGGAKKLEKKFFLTWSSATMMVGGNAFRLCIINYRDFGECSCWSTFEEFANDETCARLHFSIELHFLPTFAWKNAFFSKIFFLLQQQHDVFASFHRNRPLQTLHDMVALMNGNNNNGSLNSVCSTPTLPPSANHQSFTFSNLPNTNTNNNVAAAALSSGRRLSTNTCGCFLVCAVVEATFHRFHRKVHKTWSMRDPVRTNGGAGLLLA